MLRLRALDDLLISFIDFVHGNVVFTTSLLGVDRSVLGSAIRQLGTVDGAKFLDSWELMVLTPYEGRT